MNRLAWLTDLHLDFVSEDAMEQLVQEVRDAHPDALLIGGDVGEARSVVGYLRLLDEMLGVPSFVVLGNHDFYRGGIASVRRAVESYASESPAMEYLTCASDPFELAKDVALVGHDGWADAREGDYNRSLVMMNDYLLIDELAAYNKHDRLAELHRLGDEAAAHIRLQLALALPRYPKVFVLTHVPPFRDACWYQGTISDDEWAPHFVCQAMGRSILDMASIYPGNEITVLCGHTHSAGECRPAPNVHVVTGAADYGRPGITQLFELM